MTNPLILITGASSGIGREMAKILAKQKYDLVLVARSADKLTELATQLTTAHQVKVETLPIDLSTPDGAYKVYDEVTRLELNVTMLVNNAGFGVYGNFTDTDLDRELKMMTVNMNAVVILTKLFVQDMINHRHGKIMNVASLLSFLPFPYYSVYSATKSFILSFSETLAAELENTGVTITTLCPGPVDTPFNTEAMWKTNAYKSNKPISPTVVAQQAVNLLLNGKGKKIVGFNNWFISNLPRVTPDSIMMKIKKQLASPIAGS